MAYRAILGTFVILSLAGNRAEGQGVRATTTAPGPRSSSQASFASISQPPPISRHHFDSTVKHQRPTSPRRDSGPVFAMTDVPPITPGQRVTAVSSSAFAIGTAVRPQDRRKVDRGFHPRSHSYFHGGREIVIIEVPRYVDLGGIPQVMLRSSWAEPCLYADPPANSRTREPGQVAPFDPTPQEVVDRMLALAGVQKSDVVYDLGAGDGRVVIAAAKKYGAKAVGFEIDPGLVKLARENVWKQRVEQLVEIRQQDFLTADLSSATVVTLYLSYDGNLALRPQLMRQLKPGTRIVSYTFDMGDWQPKIVEAYRDAAGESHTLYLWEIGAPLAFSDLRR
ncbi:MAG: methyltransferase domain-containing protein [Deltaproteobacteria bacterium]|nr:methyltransferase domain-containing protein [Deltaproteobacteria bacterium]MDZ4341281.1 methyltransferase domain-containing protein [Candidatus Binatia bacterium]